MARIAATLLIGLLLAAACTKSAASPAPKHSPPHPQRHVFLIVMENHSYDQAIAGKYTSAIAARYRVAANYHAITHPSVPNYLALTSGSTWGVQDDGYHSLPQKDIGTQLTKAGVTWRAYMEGLTADGCFDSPLPYDPGHNPFAFYGGDCPPNVVPLDAQAADLAGNTPSFNWITPDRCHDMHDCGVQAGDIWLRDEVAAITASSAWKTDGVLFITWDEDDDNNDNHVLTLVITPRLSHKVSQTPYTHYSLLATIEDLLGVGRLGSAAQATPMLDLVKP